MHGEIDAVGKSDCVVLISKYGSSKELLRLVLLLRKRGMLVFSLTSVKDNPLAELCDDNFHLPLERELYSFDLTPVTSASIQMLFLDTIALLLATTTSGYSGGEYGGGEYGGGRYGGGRYDSTATGSTTTTGLESSTGYTSSRYPQLDFLAEVSESEY